MMPSPESMFISTFFAGMLFGIIITLIIGRLALIGIDKKPVRNPYEHPKG